MALGAEALSSQFLRNEVNRRKRLLAGYHPCMFTRFWSVMIATPLLASVISTHELQ